MFINKQGLPIQLKNIYKDAHCFLIGSGPSLLNEDLSFLSERGILSMGMNNVAAKNIKPNLWTCFDNPKCFHESIWLDPSIMKFVPEKEYSNPFILKGKISPYPVKECSNTFGINTAAGYDHKRFLDFPFCQFGLDPGKPCSIGLTGQRSVFYVALKLLFILGIKNVYLVGCDFWMEHDPKQSGLGKTYAFEQYKWKGGCFNNNQAYIIMNKRLNATNKHFADKGFTIINCTKDSKLSAFPYCLLQETVSKIQELFPKKISTQGYYGGKENLNKHGF
jgi:hypothetical protein